MNKIVSQYHRGAIILNEAIAKILKLINTQNVNEIHNLPIEFRQEMKQFVNLAINHTMITNGEPIPFQNLEIVQNWFNQNSKED